MDAAFFLGLVKAHFGSILVFALVAVTWWKGGFEQLSSLVAKVEEAYDKLRKEAEERRFYAAAKTAFEWANDEGKRLAAKTENTVDDAIIDKGVMALEMGLKLLKKMGLADDGAEDRLKAHFGEFHAAERKAKELSGNLSGAPGSNS